MLSIYVAGCCLLVAVVLTPSDAGLFTWNTKNEPDIPVGLVKGEASKPKTNPQPQDVKKPTNQAKGVDSGTANPTKPASVGATQTKVPSPPVKPKTEPPSNVVKSDQKTGQNPTVSSPAAAAKGALTVAEAKQANSKNIQAAKAMDKQTNELKKDLKNDIKNKDKDESLDDLVQDLIDISKRRFRVKFALIIYAIINFILWVAQYAGGFITPPVGKALYYLDMLAKNVVRKPLNDYYAEFQIANAEAVAKYIRQHPEEFKHAKVGKRIIVKTPKGEFNFKVTKKNPGEALQYDDLHIVDKNPIKVLGAVMGLKKR